MLTRVARAILIHHQELQGDQRRAYADPYRAAKVRAFLALRPFTGSPRDVQSILESYNVRERQTKYINNSMRAYEHLGLEWALPMLDVEFWDAWHRGAVELTATRDFYAVFIGRLWARATALAAGAEAEAGQEWARAVADRVDKLVLDAGDGGSGTSFNWETIPAELAGKTLLAGGINPQNLAEALAAGTVGLDLNSGFEYAPGKKDTGALNSAFDIIRAYYPHDPRA